MCDCTMTTTNTSHLRAWVVSRRVFLSTKTKIRYWNVYASVNSFKFLNWNSLRSLLKFYRSFCFSAHIYLSLFVEQIIRGYMISDWLKDRHFKLDHQYICLYWNLYSYVWWRQRQRRRRRSKQRSKHPRDESKVKFHKFFIILSKSHWMGEHNEAFSRKLMRDTSSVQRLRDERAATRTKRNKN